MDKRAFKRLIEEVRDGFFIPASVKQAWAADMEVYKEIDRICQKYDISYFADWGSLLGAVRHGGIIPWDDDIDLVMKRQDYEKFLKVSENEMASGYKVLTYCNQAPENWMFMGKVVAKEHICFEPDHLRTFYNYPYIASVDIFVLDYMYENPEKEQRRRDLCLYMFGVANAIVEGSLKGVQIRNNLLHIKKTWDLSLDYIEDPVEMGRYLYGKIEEQFSCVRPDESSYLCQMFPWGLKGTARTYKKEFYEKAIRLPFEDTTIPVPVAFDGMLKARYGDYLKLVKNGGAHEYPNFEVQKKTFMAATGVDMPRYLFGTDEISRRTKLPQEEGMSFKEMIRYGCRELGVPDSVEAIVEMQQLAIELGNLIEEVKGQGTACVHILEEYCEFLFGLHTVFQKTLQDNQAGRVELKDKADHICQQLQMRVEAFEKEVTESILNKKLIIILSVYDFEVDTVKALISAIQAGQKQNIETRTVVLDYYRKDYDGRLLDAWNDLSAWENENVLTQNEMTIERLGFLHPEMLVVTNGYDQWNENVSIYPNYYSDHLLSCTDDLVYYSPYNVDSFSKDNEKEYINLQYYVLCPGVVKADHIVVPDDNIRSAYIEKLTEFSGDEYKECWAEKVICRKEWMQEQGFVFDNQVREDKNDSKEKKLLYGISLGAVLEKEEVAINKIRNNLKVMADAPQLKCTIYLFPNLSDEVYKINPVICKALEEVLRDCDVIREERDNLLAGEFDAYYGDGNPIAAKCVRLHKPVMIQNYEV